MNKYKKMLKYYDEMVWSSIYDASFVEARTTLGELVERAICKKNEMYWEDNIIRHFVCPSCEYELGEDEVDRQIGYCPECGQSLDWTEYDGRRFM